MDGARKLNVSRRWFVLGWPLPVTGSRQKGKDGYGDRPKKVADPSDEPTTDN